MTFIFFLTNSHIPTQPLHPPQPFLTFKSLIKNYQSQRSFDFTKDFWGPTMKFENSLNSSLSIILPFFTGKETQTYLKGIVNISFILLVYQPLEFHFFNTHYGKNERRENEEDIPKYRSDDFWEVPGLALRASHDLRRCSRCPVPSFFTLFSFPALGKLHSKHFQPK